MVGGKGQIEGFGWQAELREMRGLGLVTGDRRFRAPTLVYVPHTL